MSDKSIVSNLTDTLNIIQVVTEDGNVIQCNKKVLEESSSFFRKVLTNLKSTNVIFVPDAKSSELEYIISLLNTGQKFTSLSDDFDIDSLLILTQKLKFQEITSFLLEQKEKRLQQSLDRLKQEVKSAFIDAGIQFKQFKTKFSPTSVLEKAVKHEGVYIDKQSFGDLQCETTIKILGQEFVATGVTVAVSRKAVAIKVLKELFGFDYAAETKIILMNASCNKKYVPGVSSNGASDKIKEVTVQQKAFDYIKAQLRLKKLSSVSPVQTLQTITDRKTDIKFTSLKKSITCVISYLDKHFTAQANDKIRAANLAACSALEELYQISFNYYHSTGEGVTMSVSLKIDEDWRLLIQKVNPTPLDKTLFKESLTQRLNQAMQKFSSTPVSRLKSRFVHPPSGSSDKPLLTESEWRLLEEIDTNAVPSSDTSFHIIINDTKIEGVGKTPVLAKDELIMNAFKFLEDLEGSSYSSTTGTNKRKIEENPEITQPALKKTVKEASWQEKLRKLHEQCTKEGKSIRDLPPIEVLNDIGLNIGMKLDGRPDNPNVTKIKRYAEDTLRKLLEVMGF